MLALYGQLSDQLAAESIARHVLRSALISSTSQNQLNHEVTRQLGPLQLSWGKKVTKYRLGCAGSCSNGSLVNLEVWVRGGYAIQSGALAPK
jgi:hypothetical protein